MSERLRVVVVGAGAWGLPAAAELARRGHAVTCVDRAGPGNALASSHGATRIWRLAHADRVRVRLARRAVEAWECFEARAGAPCRIEVGLLWRNGAYAEVADALDAEGVPHRLLAADEVGEVFPGLVPDGAAAVWQPEAGAVLADRSIAAFAGALESHGGVGLWGRSALGVRELSDGLRVELDDGSVIDADRVVVAAGPWSGRLLRTAGLDIPLRPVVQQVTYVGGPADESLPCLVDGGDEEGDNVFMYAMPTPGMGYKAGIEVPMRELDPDRDDGDRSPSPAIAEMVSRRIARILPGVSPTITGTSVCTWTYGPDGQFVIDTALGGRLAYACGDSGEGFKFAALMGESLADLAEGVTLDADLGTFALARFGGHPPEPPTRMHLGQERAQ